MRKVLCFFFVSFYLLFDLMKKDDIVRDWRLFEICVFLKGRIQDMHKAILLQESQRLVPLLPPVRAWRGGRISLGTAIIISVFALRKVKILRYSTNPIKGGFAWIFGWGTWYDRRLTLIIMIQWIVAAVFKWLQGFAYAH